MKVKLNLALALSHGARLLIFALFNLLFINGFFKTAYKYSKPFLLFSIAAYIIVMLAETLHHAKAQ